MIKNGIIWMIGIALAIVSGLVAVGAIAKNKAPQLAISMQPLNGYAAENLASAQVKSMVAKNNGQFPDRIDPNASSLAREAFTAEPVTPEAIAVIALGTAENDRRKLMNQALSLSRREQFVTGWMVTDSGAREDLPGLLNAYDIMLRSNSSVASLVLPVMADALANDNFIDPFVDLLSKKPPWSNQFWGTVVGKPNSLNNAAQVREAIFTPNEDKTLYRDSDLIPALIGSEKFVQAERLYDLFVVRKQSESIVDNDSFKDKSFYPPFDWQLFSTGEYGAVIGDGKLEFSAISDSGGLFANQIVNMPMQILALEVSSNASTVENAQIFITLKCAQTLKRPLQNTKFLLKDKVEKIRIDNSNSGCRFYWLGVEGRTSGNGDGFDASISSIVIVPN